jgi:hypothetical protein
MPATAMEFPTSGILPDQALLTADKFTNNFVGDMLGQEPTYLHIFVNKGLPVQVYLKHIAMAAYEAGLLYGSPSKRQPELILLVAPDTVSSLHEYIRDNLNLSAILYTDKDGFYSATTLALEPVTADIKNLFESYRPLVMGS